MRRCYFGMILLLFVACFNLNAQNGQNAFDSSAKKVVYVRYDSEGRAPWAIRAKGPAGRVRVENAYTEVYDNIFDRLKRRECVTYWYTAHRESDNHFTIYSKSKKNSIGFSATYFFYGKLPWQKMGWMKEDYVGDFNNPSYNLNDFSVYFYIGRQLVARNRHHFGLNLGAGFRQTKQVLKTDGYNIRFDAIDPDGAPYIRHVDISNYTESQLVRSVIIPISFRYDWFMFKHFSVFLAAGVQNDFHIQNDITTTFDARYAGQYNDDLFNVLIDQEGYYDFGEFNNNTFERTDEEEFRYSLYGVGAVGLQVFLGKTLSIEVAGEYHKRLYSNTFSEGSSGFRLVSSNETRQSMQSCLSPYLLDRLGVNVKLKFTF